LYCYVVVFFFFKQKTAYEMRISDWSSDVCSSDQLADRCREAAVVVELRRDFFPANPCRNCTGCERQPLAVDRADRHALAVRLERLHCPAVACALRIDRGIGRGAALALLLRRGPPHRLRELGRAHV